MEMCIGDEDLRHQTIIIAKIQAELLKRILPSYKSPVLAVKWMKIISENYQKMESVHKELLKKVKEREDNSIADCFRKLEKERMDKLSQIRLKLRASQYLENLRNEVLAVNLYRTEKRTERQREEPMADLNVSRQTIIIAKIQAELLKRILPSYKSPVMAVKWMKIINENHQKMESVHKELSKKIKEREDNSIADSFGKLEIIKMEMCIGDEDLRHQKERMDKLSQIRLKIRASQYLENLRIEVLADNLYRTEKKTERQREEPMADLNVSRQTIIIAKIQAELLKRILPSYKSPVLAVQWMKIINENHQKMESVHKELSKRVKEREDCFRKLEKERMDRLSQIRLILRASQYLENLRNEVLAVNPYRTEKKVERQREEPMADLNESRQTIIIAKIQAELLKKILPSYKSPVLAVKWMKKVKEREDDSIADSFRKLEKERKDKLSQIRLKLRASQYLENLRNEVLAVNLYRTEKRTERQREEPMADLNESRQTIVIAKIQAELLKKILPSYESPVLAVKWMEIINENKQKMESVHKELLKEVKEKEGNSIRDSFRKLENVNQSKWNDTLDAWSKEKRNQIVFSILVDQVRKIRTRKCPQMAGKNMKRLQDRHLVLIKLQGELMKIVKERASMRQTKKIVEEELLMEIKRKDKMKKRGKMLQIELINHCERSDEEDTHFTPRKLFLNSVETFKIVPKLENESNVVNERKDGPSVSLTCEDQPQPLLKREKKPTLKSRIKKMFGFH